MKKIFLLLLSLLLYISCTNSASASSTETTNQETHQDTPFLQDYSIKYYLEDTQGTPQKVFADRNGRIQLLTSNGLYQPRNGQFLFPGTFVKDNTYRTSATKKIAGIDVYQNQFIYVDDKAVLSHAWAGKVYAKHTLPDAKMLISGKDFDFIISNGHSLRFLQNGQEVYKANKPGGKLIDMKFDESRNLFWILSKDGLTSFSSDTKKLEEVFTGVDFTAFALSKKGKEILIGTSNGYLLFDPVTKKQIGKKHQKLPATNITYLTEINGNIWVGTTQGAFMIREDGKFNYYYGERWMPGEVVQHISAGLDNSVLILTDAGLGHIHFREMTLHDKAQFFQKQVRARHIRLGFNATLVGMDKGDVTTGYLGDSDNDGLWTSMYLGAEAFRYAVTQSEEALQNIRESMEAMERLYSINPVEGFPSRSFERSGYISQLSDPHRWQNSSDPEWDWKATTSSDEAIGHIFAFGVIAELVDDEALREQSIKLIDTLMQHIVDNDLYLIDYDGKPTQWGKWNPDYVNGHPKMVGDRKLNSSNIIGMLQTAYHFTKKEIYKTTAFDLIENHGYLENLMRPINEIGVAPTTADPLSQNLSESWNHSDDEMYYMGYWGLYRYAFNEELKEKFKAAIIDHWESERPEKEGLWNIFTAFTGKEKFDLQEAIWYLQEYPLDLVTWTMKNSHRKDIETIAPNFRNQSTKEVLPPDELRISRHNANRFILDGGNGGRAEYSAGDIWLLPYWMGRYLGVISNPKK